MSDNRVPAVNAHSEPLPEAPPPQLVIVSVFGRGNRLAALAAEQGYKVLLLDATSSFLRHKYPDTELTSEIFSSGYLDAKGPLGFFQTEKDYGFKPTPAHFASVPQGFCVWTKKGALEATSSVAEFQRKRWGLDPRLIDFLTEPEQNAQIFRKTMRSSLLPFSEVWLASLAMSVSSLEMREKVWDLDFHSEAVPPLFSPYFLPQIDSVYENAQLELAALKSDSIRVTSDGWVSDIRKSSGAVDAVEFQVKNSGGSVQTLTETLDALVWCLNERESLSLSPRLSWIFPKKQEPPSWRWVRLRVLFTQKLSAAQMAMFSAIPDGVCCIEDEFLPWTHANFYLVRKLPEQAGFDCWLRVAESSPSPLAISALLLAQLSERLPGMPLPSEVTWPPTRLGCAIFSEHGLKEQIQVASNLLLLNSEQAGSLDFNAGLRLESEIASSLKKIKEKKANDFIRKALKEKKLASVDADFSSEEDLTP